MSINLIWNNFHKITSFGRKVIEKKLSKFNLTSSEGEVLLFIYFNQEVDINQDFLCSTGGIDKARISRILNSLESKEFIKRVIDDKDKRSKKIQLTKKGKSCQDDLIKAYNDLYLVALKGIDKDKFREIEELLQKVLINFSSEIKE